MESSKERRVFFLDKQVNGHYEKFALFSNRKLIYQYLQEHFDLVQYAPDGKKKSAFKRFGVYTQFVYHLRNSFYVRMYAEKGSKSYYFRIHGDVMNQNPSINEKSN